MYGGFTLFHQNIHFLDPLRWVDEVYSLLEYFGPLCLLCNAYERESPPSQKTL